MVTNIILVLANFNGGSQSNATLNKHNGKSTMHHENRNSIVVLNFDTTFVQEDDNNLPGGMELIQ